MSRAGYTDGPTPYQNVVAVAVAEQLPLTDEVQPVSSLRTSIMPGQGHDHDHLSWPWKVGDSVLEHGRPQGGRRDRGLSGTLLSVLAAVPPAIQALLSAYRRRLEEQYGPRLTGLTLFGSYARGEGRADSDVDVAVVLDRIESPSERMLPMEIAGDLTVEYGLAIAPIVLSKDEMEFLHQREDLLAENLDREGIPI